MIEELNKKVKRSDETQALHPQNKENINKSKGNKSYLIKSLLDQYIKELIHGLNRMGGLSSKEVEELIALEIVSLTKYSNELMKENIKRLQKC